MGYNSLRPADDDYISVGPGVIRENQEALKTGGIVNAGTLTGKSAGNASGQIALSNGTKCENLNADKLDDKDASEFAAASHGHNVATANDDGFMSNTDKQKINGVQAGAEVNQNAFGAIYKSPGGPNILALSKQDILTFVEGANISIVGSADMRSLIISLTGTVPNASNANTAGNANLLQGNSAAAFASANHKYHPGEGYSYNPNGYFRMPDQDGFFSGLILQWFNTGNLAPGTGAYFSLPVALLNCTWKKAFSGSTSNAIPIFTFPSDSQIFVLNGGAVSGAFYVLVLGQTSI